MNRTKPIRKKPRPTLAVLLRQATCTYFLLYKPAIPARWLRLVCEYYLLMIRALSNRILWIFSHLASLAFMDENKLDVIEFDCRQSCCARTGNSLLRVALCSLMWRPEAGTDLRCRPIAILSIGSACPRESISLFRLLPFDQWELKGCFGNQNPPAETTKCLAFLFSKADLAKFRFVLRVCEIQLDFELIRPRPNVAHSLECLFLFLRPNH